MIPSSEFDFDPVNKTCVCPAKENMWLGSELIDRKGHGRQVSFIISKGQRVPNHTDWMKHRVDSDKGKLIYSPKYRSLNQYFETLGRIKGLVDLVYEAKRKSRDNGNCTV